MSEYRRLYRQQGWYFFTVVTYNREKILIQPDNLKRLRLSFHHVMKKYPFIMDAVVILPDHIHCIWRLPPDDDDFSTHRITFGLVDSLRLIHPTLLTDFIKQKISDMGSLKLGTDKQSLSMPPCNPHK